MMIADSKKNTKQWKHVQKESATLQRIRVEQVIGIVVEGEDGDLCARTCSACGH